MQLSCRSRTRRRRADGGPTKSTCALPRATTGHTSRVFGRCERATTSGGMPPESAGRAELRGRTEVAPAGPLRARAREAAADPVGVYYVPFGQPLGARGAGSVALHVADGSQVIAERVGGRRLTVFVGAKGRERYGSCLARLGAARLASGYQPIMTTTYTDASRVRYRQESLAAQACEMEAGSSASSASTSTRGAPRRRPSSCV